LAQLARVERATREQGELVERPAVDEARPLGQVDAEAALAAGAVREPGREGRQERRARGVHRAPDPRATASTVEGEAGGVSGRSSGSAPRARRAGARAASGRPARAAGGPAAAAWPGAVPRARPPRRRGLRRARPRG